MPRQKATNALLGIPRSRAIELASCDGPLQVMQISRKPQPEGRTCPHCGRVNGRVHGRVWRRMLHGPVDGMPCALRVPTYRRRCPDCGRTRYEPDGIRSGDCPHASADLKALIAVELMRRQPVRGISRRMGPSEDMACAVLDTMETPPPRLPRVLRIDESEAGTDRGKRAVAVVDGEMGWLVDVPPDRSAETLDAWFGQFTDKEREAVDVSNCDMRATCISAAERWPPFAEVCIDRFHVVEVVTRARALVRVRVQNGDGMTAERAKKLKGCRRILCMRPDDLAERDAKRVARGKESPKRKAAWALAPGPDLALAHERLMSFYRWSDAGGTRRGLGNWTGVSQDCGVPEAESAARTTKRHRERILNGRRLDSTNAAAEGMNNAIKALKRVCFGFGRFERMRRRCLLVLGCTRLVEEKLGLKAIPKA